MHLRNVDLYDARAGCPASDQLGIEVEADLVDVVFCADRHCDGAFPAGNGGFGGQQNLDADLTGWVVEHDGVLTQVVPVGIRGHRAHMGASDDLAEWNRNRPRRAIAAAELLAVVEELY